MKQISIIFLPIIIRRCGQPPDLGLRHRVTYVGMQTQVKNWIRALLAKQREEVRQIVVLEENLFKVSGRKVLGSFSLF